MTSRVTFRRRGAALVLGAYALLLASSWAVRLVDRGAELEPQPRERFVQLFAVDGHSTLDREIELAVTDLGSSAGAPVVLLLHGSPGSKEDLARLARALSRGHRVVAPDLPGFGRSEPRVPDYSIRAHARYARDLLDALGVEKVHVVGFSMGGGVALELERLAKDRVASITLLASIGVQELELLGDHHVNHAIHGLQLIVIRAVDLLVPHFGKLDRFPLDIGYARNFYDSDQRPLRDLLGKLDGPVLIVHGTEDSLVPVEAAREHFRIVPQSELVLYDGGHFTVFTRPEPLAESIAAFIGEVEAGRARTRPLADASRVAIAAQPYDGATAPAARGLALVLLFSLLVLATFVSEDLTCIAAGLLASDGRIDFASATAACLTGIVLGDLSLFLAGRWIGRAALSRAPLRWILRPHRVERSCRWFERRGLLVIVLTRFVPGTRLPTYFAAGLLGTGVLRFLLYFLAAAVVWTPLLVGIAAATGSEAGDLLGVLRRRGFFGLLLAALFVLALIRLALPALTHRGRRRLLSTWRRWTRFEFWPPWLFYAPLVVYVLGLGVRSGRPALFTAANPMIDAGGFVGESKSQILGALDRAGAPVARFSLIAAGLSVGERSAAASAFMDGEDARFPVVLKPDRGQRGERVAIARSEADVRKYLDANDDDILIQRYVPGQEFGLFYVRRPGETRGRIVSITEKKRPFVVGDGRRTLEELILDDDRAVAIHAVYADENAARLGDVPAHGETVELVEIGTHARGAIFADGRGRLTEDLEEAIDGISRAVPGFFFGRYDVRVPDPESLERGRDITILELNGVTSEATHIYDPSIGLAEAYRTLFAQWRAAFEIGRLNAERGHAPEPLLRVLGLAVRHVLR